jgi:3-dehydroquinate synthase
MIKHGLIYSPEHLEELEIFDLENIDYDHLQEIIRHSVNVKEYFVANDPTEKNIRKALNFGHTIGHAFESYAWEQNRPIQHGHAVAYGMIAELYLSVKICNFPQSDFQNLTNWLLKLYGKFQISANDFDSLFELMTHDKKNEADRINFTLLSEIGKIEINQNCERDLIYESLVNYVNL